MDARGTALAALRLRLGRVQAEGAAGLLTGEAVEEAATLERTADLGEDLFASCALGLFHWYRFEALLSEDAKREEFDAAVRFLFPVYQVEPKAVPEQLRRFFAHAGARAESDERANATTRRAVDLLQAYQRSGQLPLLIQAVDLFRDALRDAPEGHPGHARGLSNLSAALQPLFGRTGDTALLAEAMDVGRRALQAVPEGHSDRAGLLNNLSATMQTMYDRTGDTALLSEAVHVGWQAVKATPEGHPDRARHLSNFSAALQALFERTGNTEPLGMAIDVGLQAVNATPEDDPDHARYLNNLGTAMLRLFKRTEDIALLAEAVKIGRRSVLATPRDHPDHAARLSNLGNALRTLFEWTADPQASAEAVDAYRSASQNAAATALVRVQAFCDLAVLADAEEGLAAVESAVDLLPQISPRTLARGDREYQVGRLGGALANAAAAAALNAGCPQRAVELLEATRGMLVADTVDARGGDVARLREHAPELAREFEDLRDRREALDVAPTRGSDVDGVAPGGPERAHGDDRLQARLQARRRAQAEWDALVGRIRAVDGFPRFLAAPSIPELTAQAAQGPIVFLTAGPTRCDALIVTGDPADPVRTVALDRLTRKTVSTRAEQLLQARTTATAIDQSPEVRKAAQLAILEVLAWLWDTVAEPILTSLGHTATPAEDGDWPRVWWCPVGVMGYLPLHAAGHHRDLGDDDPAVGAAPRTVLDRVVSSYTPTVRALAYARSHPPSTADPGTTLVIAVPDAPGTTPLPGVHAEADAIAALIPTALRPAHPVRAQVLAALPEHPVAHFSCHGLADWNDPAASRLILYDHQGSPLTVADISALHLTGTLAFLSACDTSSTSPRLTDEALHLTGAFHLAGYQNVIGTLWPVDDHTATRIATDFYTHLTNGGTTPPEAATSGHALHHAIRALRTDYPATPTLWAAHTHTGI